MAEKFTLEDLLIKIIPGGVLIGVLYFLFSNQIDLKIENGLDFFYTFLFFTFSYLAGEVIQTIAHELEWIIFSFFKFYKPSEIFMYKNNPVLKNEYIRQQLFNHLNLDSSEITSFDKSYKELPFWWWKREKQIKSQSIFWKLYSEISADAEIKIFNRNFLFVRAITFVTLGLSILFSIKDYRELAAISILLFILFLWRARGMARTLVFKTVILNLKAKK
ncbi:MAG: hypothetical protein LLG13_06995 [Bacteroidales bacterium]|nr:hypothetical protein [Bacteroidales bacterium]